MAEGTQRKFLHLLGQFTDSVNDHRMALGRAAERSVDLNDFCIRVMTAPMPFDLSSLTHDVADLREMFRKAERSEAALLESARALEAYVTDLNS